MNTSEDINLEQRIDAYIKGRLSEEEAEQLWVELLKHPEYISLLKTEIDVARRYKEKSWGLNTAAYYWKWIASTAAVVLLLITINILSTDEQQPIKSWVQRSIELQENLSSAEVTRSSTARLDPADSLLNTGFKAAISGKNEEAIEIFQQIITRYDSTPAISKAYLNLGILQYNSGEFSASINSFNEAITRADDDSLLIERSYWYLSNALINTDQLKQARDAVEHAFGMGKIYKNEAFKLLKRLDYKLGNIDFDNFEQQMQESE